VAANIELAPPFSVTDAVKNWLEALVVGGIVNVTVPLPVPVAGEALSPLAVQAQAALVVVTFTVASPPAAVTVTLGGAIASAQLDPNCVM
jgi:hypothetical protein